MYTVYLGMHEISGALGSGQLGQGAIKVPVRAVITVNNLKLILLIYQAK